MATLVRERMAFIYDKNLWISLLVTMGLYTVCFALFPVRFEENDDFILSLIARGYFTGTPDYHLVYISSLTGRFLAVLYSLNQNIPWYSLLLLFLQFISIICIFYALLTKKSHSKILVLGLCFPLAYFIINLQFTSITILLAFSGIILFDALQPKTHLGYLVPILLLFFSSLIRFEAFAFALLVGGLFLLPKIIREKRFSFVIALVIITLIPQVINTLDYQDDKWAYFNQYVKLLSITGDNPLVLGHKTTISNNLNLPENNLNLLERYILIQDFDKITLNNIYNLAKTTNYVSGVFSELRNFIRHYIVLESCLFLLFIYALLYSRWLLIPIILPNILFALIILERTPKDRVVIGGLLIAIVLTLINLPHLRREFVWLILIIVVGFFSIKIVKSTSASSIDYSSLNTNRIYTVINPGNVIGGRETAPFDLNYIGDRNIVIGGWLTNSPLMIEQLKRYGISSAEPHISLLDNDEINEKTLYLDRNNSRAKEVYNEIQKYLNSKGKVLSIESQNDSLIIYRISRQAN